MRGHGRILTLLLGTLALLVGQFATTQSRAEAAPAVERVAGNSRADTAARVAAAGWDTAPHVLLATTADYPDALAGSVAAAKVDAPVLLTESDRLPQVVRDTLAGLQTRRVTLLGGTSAISSRVEAALREAGYDVDRVAGRDRYATAARLARLTVGDRSTRTVALALGDRAGGHDAWPDALAGATLAGLDATVPILLTHPGDLPGATRRALRDVGAEQVLLLGGPAAIPDEIAAQVREIAPDTDRIYGRTRYGTAVEVAEAAIRGIQATGSIQGATAVFVSGEHFVDALPAGALAAHRDAPLLLVPRERLADSVDGFLRDGPGSIDDGLLVGTSEAVSGFVHEELDAAVRGAPRPEHCDPAYSSPDCAYTYEHPVRMWEDLAECESGGNWSINTGNGYYGGLQFSKAAWDSVGGHGYPHQNTKWEQIHRGEMLQDRQGWSAWPHCTHQLGYR